MLVTSVFSSSHNVFKWHFIQGGYKSGLCGKELTLSQTTILDSSKLKEFADDNFKFNENGRVLHTVRKHWEKEKLLVMSNFSFSHSVFKRLVLQTHKNQGLFGKGLKKQVCCPHDITEVMLKVLIGMINASVGLFIEGQR